MQGRDLTIIVVAIAVVVLLFGLLGGGMMGFGGMWPGMMGGYYGPGFGMGGVLMMLFWVLIVVGVVLLVAWLARQAGVSSAGPGQESTALEILKRRYARGEITKEQFEQMRRDLE